MRRRILTFCLCALVASLAALVAGPGIAAEPAPPLGKRENGKKKIVFVAGKPSHGRLEHEYHAGCLLLAAKLRDFSPGWDIRVIQNGWPEDDSVFDEVDAIVLSCDGDAKHCILPQLDAVDAMMRRGTGLVVLHYALGMPDEKSGGKMLDWIGGYFDPASSVCIYWNTEIKSLPDHPIARGVEAFDLDDECYFNLRFRPAMKGVTPILTAIPPDELLDKQADPAIRAMKGHPQHIAWATERADGGRGFGFSGGHFHKNWSNDDMRRLVLNAIVWTAKANVPDGGVPSTVAEGELAKNLDPKGKRGE